MSDPVDILTTDADILRANQAYPGFGYTIIPGEAMGELLLCCDRTGRRTVISIPKGHSVIFTLPPKDYTESRLVPRGVDAPVNPLEALREQPAEERITTRTFRHFAIVRYHLRRRWHIWIDCRISPGPKEIEFVVCVVELDRFAKVIDFADVSFPKLVHALKYVNGVKPKAQGEKMIGAIIGDMVGSIYEHDPIAHKVFPLFSAGCRFTDDTVLTVAIAKAILDGTAYKDSVLEFGHRYPNAGYGKMFKEWLRSENNAPYNSYGNGSAMRVSPVGWAFDTVDRVLEEAKRTAEITHNHPEGIKGAQAIALAIFLARTGSDKCALREEITARFGYDLSLGTDHYRGSTDTPMILCQHAVPAALAAFHESDSFEDAVRIAVSIGDDSDTLAAITGSVAEAFYGPAPYEIRAEAQARLPEELFFVVRDFQERYAS